MIGSFGTTPPLSASLTSPPKGENILLYLVKFHLLAVFLPLPRLRVAVTAEQGRGSARRACPALRGRGGCIKFQKFSYLPLPRLRVAVTAEQGRGSARRARGLYQVSEILLFLRTRGSARRARGLYLIFFGNFEFCLFYTHLKHGI